MSKWCRYWVIAAMAGNLLIHSTFAGTLNDLLNMPFSPTTADQQVKDLYSEFYLVDQQNLFVHTEQEQAVIKAQIQQILYSFTSFITEKLQSENGATFLNQNYSKYRETLYFALEPWRSSNHCILDYSDRANAHTALATLLQAKLRSNLSQSSKRGLLHDLTSQQALVIDSLNPILQSLIFNEKNVDRTETFTRENYLPNQKAFFESVITLASQSLDKVAVLTWAEARLDSTVSYLVQVPARDQSAHHRELLIQLLQDLLSIRLRLAAAYQSQGDFVSSIRIVKRVLNELNLFQNLSEEVDEAQINHLYQLLSGAYLERAKQNQIIEGKNDDPTRSALVKDLKTFIKMLGTPESVDSLPTKTEHLNALSDRINPDNFSLLLNSPRQVRLEYYSLYRRFREMIKYYQKISGAEDGPQTPAQEQWRKSLEVAHKSIDPTDAWIKKMRSNSLAYLAPLRTQLESSKISSVTLRESALVPQKLAARAGSYLSAL